VQRDSHFWLENGGVKGRVDGDDAEDFFLLFLFSALGKGDDIPFQSPRPTYFPISGDFCTSFLATGLLFPLEGKKKVASSAATKSGSAATTEGGRAAAKNGSL